MKYILFFSLSALFMLNAGAQSHKDWKNRLQNIKTTAAKIDSLCEWAQIEADRVPPLAQEIKDSCLKLVKPGTNNKAIAFCHKLQGILYDQKSQYPAAVKEYLLASHDYRLEKDSMGDAKCEANIGIILEHSKKYEEAIGYFYNSLKYFQKVNLLPAVFLVKENIGLSYMQLGLSDSTLKYFRDLEKQLSTFPSQKANLLENLGLAYASTKNYELSVGYLKQSIAEYEKNAPDNPRIYLCIQNLANTLQQCRRSREALPYAEKTLAYYIANEMEYTREGVSLYEGLARIYESLNEYQKESHAFYMMSVIKDSIYNTENLQQLNAFKAQYEDEKKKLLIDKLNLEKDLQNKLFDTEQKRKRILSVALVIALLCLMALSYLMLQKIKDNHLIRIQKKDIEQRSLLLEVKQKEILDSIHYANRIQNALLPNEYSIEKILKKLNG
jgi:tetratricopeptide (TPR) repeat protein